MRRQGGLGRTLADLLPDEKDTAPHPVGHHFPERASDAETDEPSSHQDEDPGMHPGVTDDDAPDADTGTSPEAQAFRDYAECLDKARPEDTEALQKCADLLKP